MRKFVKRIASDISGATAVEYGLILAMIFLAMLAAIQTLEGSTSSMWNKVATDIEEAKSQSQ
ncbi:Flp family type IVb pilin [Altererythrobacter sp. TH136]|uniref:Flp family type IVb pilin n=1 Tax=Altererythrobacter sp. TH136 TaxID=2067415 RepID=UPI0011637559|nr:Flp family type IVb pilin [Altererythrobacter sp. TH136]QDM40176.1 Flp family type IVb pilin [Altererythrobacter sp. TH136]